MKILIVAATAAEVAPFIKEKELKREIPLQAFRSGSSSVTLLITGVGMTLTAYTLGQLLVKENFDLAFQAGISGCFKKEIAVGTVVNVLRDRFADLGAEDDERFLDVFSLNLANANEFPFREGWIYNDSVLTSPMLNPLFHVRGITVNKVHGNEKSIARITELYHPDVESMEGAAFAYACAMHKLPYFQIRAVSNHVEKRNRENWNIPLAIKNLNNWLLLFVNGLVE
jgi:futalosine hydrolase